MDEKGIHSPMNAIGFTVSDDNDTASSVQMKVAGKHTSNLFIVVISPKNEDKSSS